jgi:hypothetical protein
MEIFNNDVSYLYSDEYLTSSSSNEKELPQKASKSSKYRSIGTLIYRKRSPTLSIGHRSKHIVLFRKEAFKRKKTRISTKRLIENLHKKIQELEDEQLFLENDLRERQLYKQDLETKINNNFYMKSLTELLSTNKDKMGSSFDQYLNDIEFLNMSTTRILNLNNDLNDNLDN